MKNKLLVQTRRVLFLIVFFQLTIFNQAWSQNDPKIVMEMKKGDKIKNVNEGKKVRIWYEGEKYAGYIDSIGAESLFIDGNEFTVNKIEKIGIKYKGTIITGAVVGTAGVLFGSLGVYIIISGQNSGTLGGVVAILLGVMVEVVSIPVIIVGSTVTFIGKKYKKEKGWEFKVAQLN